MFASLTAPDLDPRRHGAPTDDAESESGWATATGTLSMRRPDGLHPETGCVSPDGTSDTPAEDGAMASLTIL